MQHEITNDLFDFVLRGRLPVLLMNDRKFKVHVCSTLSYLHEQVMGVPQGSILSP